MSSRPEADDSTTRVLERLVLDQARGLLSGDHRVDRALLEEVLRRLAAEVEREHPSDEPARASEPLPYADPDDYARFRRRTAQSRRKSA